MLFFSFFKTLVDQEVIVELKNDIEIKGTLRSVDQFLNLKLDNISTVNETKYPHLKAVKTLFVRGSTVRYVHLNATSVDCTLLQDASRRGMFFARIRCGVPILTHKQKQWFWLESNWPQVPFPTWLLVAAHQHVYYILYLNIKRKSATSAGQIRLGVPWLGLAGLLAQPRETPGPGMAWLLAVGTCSLQFGVGLFSGVISCFTHWTLRCHL